MKKVITFVFFISLTFSTSAQNNYNKELLTKKWKIDLVAMKSIIQLMITENPEMAAMDDLNKEVAVNSALDQISAMTIEYQNDGIVHNTTSKGKNTGTWKWDSETNDLVTKTNEKPEKKYKIIALTSTKLHLKTQDNKDLHLIAE